MRVRKHGDVMKLEQIHLQNFRLFSDFCCDFDPQLTVLVANNGGGKTSLLEAIFFALYPFTGHFPNSGFQYPSHERDVKTYIANRNRGQIEKSYPMKIDVQSNLESEGIRRSYTWWFLLDGPASPPQATLIQLVNPEDEFDQLAIVHKHFAQDQNWPLLAFYHTDRLSVDEKMTSGSETQASMFKERQVGYTNCTAACANYKLVLNWLDYATRTNTAEFARHLSQNPDVLMRFSDFEGSFSPLLKALQNAVNTVLASTGWKNIYYLENQEDLVLEHDEFGIQPLSRLSDGIRTTIGLVADIAFRAVQLNPHLGEIAVRETDGIVFIDEVDMHLHPQWQQTILPDLLRAFPKVQFIVTTHSPQVLSSVKRENIRMINLESGTIPLGMSYGEPSGTVLQSVMLVDPQPPVAEKIALQELTSLVDQGHYQEPRALELMQELSRVLNEQHPQLQRLQRSIARQEVLKKMAQKQ